MDRYNDIEVKRIIQSLINEEVSIMPVGNHHLERHLVYQLIKKDGSKAIFKLYFKKNRWNREVAALKLLSDSQVLCPKLLSYGVLEDKTEWVMIDYFEGIPYELVQKEISFENKIRLYEDMGKELGKIHSYKTFNFFGNWNENGLSVDDYQDYTTYYAIHIMSVFYELYKQDLPEKELIAKGITFIQDEFDIVSNVQEACLCHNDFGERNVLVRKNGDKWELVAVIDFEQCLPSDKDRDLVYFLDTIHSKAPDFSKAFIKGYEAYSSIGEDFYAKQKFYLVYMGLYICSWAVKQAPEHYKAGIELLRRFAV